MRAVAPPTLDGGVKHLLVKEDRMGYRNPDLYAAMKAYVSAAVAVLSERVEGVQPRC